MKRLQNFQSEDQTNFLHLSLIENQSSDSNSLSLSPETENNLMIEEPCNGCLSAYKFHHKRNKECRLLQPAKPGQIQCFAVKRAAATCSTQAR